MIIKAAVALKSVVTQENWQVGPRSHVVSLSCNLYYRLTIGVQASAFNQRRYAKK